ncbi:WYL domain-containing protein (plasmid) [Rubrobacter marinus]|uniref:WYL domain-containing protein n=2 Tax=Rubrobacter marinus TaxID=2653852 RepID=A0A6G8Q3I7_9ACTN|nr:WYL domain-containing protein [Rubrobacter marinus]
MVRIQAKPSFTSWELAKEFGVSRQTILRDLRTLSDRGVPLRSTGGPGGGYSLLRGWRWLSPSLTMDEALALIFSYETLVRYPVHPFSSDGASAVAKLRTALPEEAADGLDRLRRHVAVVGPVPEYEAPLLGELFSAALDGTHLKVVYDSTGSGTSERVIFPFGLYASRGFWYCACFDHERGANASMRADRFLTAVRVEGYERPAHVPPEEHWAHDAGDTEEERLQLRARVTERASKSVELAFIFGSIAPDGCGGGVIDAEIARRGLDYYASRLLSVGTDVVVESPPELRAAILNKARGVAGLYG